MPIRNKPDTCKLCPLYGDGKGFVPGVYPPQARVKLVGQNPGADEEAAGVPFVGKTGEALQRTYLSILGLDMADVARDNVLRCRWLPPGKRVKVNDLPPGKDLVTAIHCCAQYDRDDPTLKLVIVMGEPAFARYYPELKASEWTGHLLPVRCLDGP